MKRRDFLSGLVATAALAGPALAQDYVGSVISQLTGMGFGDIRQERTLLGRVRIIAMRKDGRREIIINPNNGEILRDLWTSVQGDRRASDIIADKSGGDNGRSGGDDSGDGGGDGGGDGDSGGGGDDDGDSSGGGGGDHEKDEDEDEAGDDSENENE